MVTRSVRSAIVGQLLKMCGMKATEDISKSLKQHRVTKDNEDLEKLVGGIQSTMNPFEMETDDNLYSLSTGIKVSEDIKTDMLSIQEKGNDWHKEFLDGCLSDGARFEKAIPRCKVKNFASAAVTAKLKTKEQKVIELQGTRNSFGRLLYLSTQENLNLSVVFRYPLTPVPLSLAHVDGTMNKTDKAKLLHKVQQMIETTEGPSIMDVVIVDAMFFLHAMHNPPL